LFCKCWCGEETVVVTPNPAPPSSLQHATISKGRNLAMFVKMRRLSPHVEAIADNYSRCKGHCKWFFLDSCEATSSKQWAEASLVQLLAIEVESELRTSDDLLNQAQYPTTSSYSIQCVVPIAASRRTGPARTAPKSIRTRPPQTLYEPTDRSESLILYMSNPKILVTLR
jgi:hypothetical protein